MWLTFSIIALIANFFTVFFIIVEERMNKPWLNYLLPSILVVGITIMGYFWLMSVWDSKEYSELHVKCSVKGIPPNENLNRIRINQCIAKDESNKEWELNSPASNTLNILVD